LQRSPKRSVRSSRFYLKMQNNVRRAGAEDIAFLAELEKAIFSLPQSAKDFETMLDAPDKVLLVAEQDGRAVGYIGAYTVCRETDILTIAVDPAARRCGVGKCLLAALIDTLREDSDVIFLEVRESNAAARSLYASFGFAELGKRRGYYKFPTEDAVLYKKELH